MYKIVCHPDNRDAVTEALKHAAGLKDPRITVDWDFSFDEFVPKDEPTGKYLLPDGRAVDKADIKITERFVEYGPEDLPWLLYSGVVREEKRALFFLVKKPVFEYKINLAFEPIMNTPFSLFGFLG